MPEEITQEAPAPQPNLTAGSEETVFSQAPDNTATHEQEVKPLDWSKLEGKEAPDFTGNQPKDTKNERTEVTKEKTTKVEDKTKQPEIKEEEETKQVDDNGDGNRKVEGEVEKDQQEQLEQQKQPEVETEGNVIDKRFPEARIFRKKMDKAAAQYFDARLADVIQKEAELEEASTALQEAQAGITQIPKSYYDNPNAIVLVPEFQRATSHVNLAAKIAAHWDNQLGNIMGGEPWRKLEYVKDAEGNVVDVRPTEQEFEANGKAQHEVGKYVRNSENQLNEMQRYQQHLQQQFHSKVSERVKLMKETEDKFFDPKTWEDKNHPNFKLTQQTKAALQSIGATEANPLFGITAKLAAEVMRLRSYASHKQQVAEKTEKVNEKARAAVPSGEATKAGGGSEVKPEEDVMADFNKMLINGR